MPAYWEIPDFPGKGDKFKVEIHSLQWGTGRPITTSVGQSTQREISAVAITEVTLTRRVDDKSPFIFTDAATGMSRSMAFYLTDESKNGKTVYTYLTVNIEDAVISSYNVPGYNANDAPIEAITLNFKKITYKHNPPPKK